MDPYDNTSKVLYVLSFIIGGNVGLPLVLLAVSFSKNVVRHAVFINWFLTWVLFSIIYLLLFYAGEFKNLLEEPPPLLCFIQAAMIYAADAMIGTSALSLIIYIERVVYRGVIGKPTDDVVLGRRFTIFFVSAPYVVFFLVFLIMIIAGTEAPKSVHRSHFYCTTSLPVKHMGTALAVGFTSVGTILLAITLFRLHRCWKQEGHITRLLPPAAGIDLSLILRVTLFSCINLLGTIISLEFISHVTGPVPNLLLSLFPLIMVLTFGTSPDLTRAYFICCRRSSSIEEDGEKAEESQVSISPV